MSDEQDFETVILLAELELLTAAKLDSLNADEVAAYEARFLPVAPGEWLACLIGGIDADHPVTTSGDKYLENVEAIRDAIQVAAKHAPHEVLVEVCQVMKGVLGRRVNPNTLSVSKTLLAAELDADRPVGGVEVNGAVPPSGVSV